MNKASGGDGIPAESLQILKDDAVKRLHSICQQIWKTQQWPQDWKRSVFILIPKKWKLLSQVWLFATPWTVQSMEFSRILEWVAFPFSRGSFQPRDQTQVSCITDRFFTTWATREALISCSKYKYGHIIQPEKSICRYTLHRALHKYAQDVCRDAYCSAICNQVALKPTRWTPTNRRVEKLNLRDIPTRVLHRAVSKWVNVIYT